MIQKGADLEFKAKNQKISTVISLLKQTISVCQNKVKFYQFAIKSNEARCWKKTCHQVF